MIFANNKYGHQVLFVLQNGRWVELDQEQYNQLFLNWEEEKKLCWERYLMQEVELCVELAISKGEEDGSYR